ncbi:MAG TPA: GFA family protein [Woeseiaceae bacterium]|nr:GFA family protein [Woeseiaceae bacterium]
MKPHFEGACLCGKLRYTIAAAPSYACHCHCRSCQRAAGAPFVTWATFPAAAFAVTGGALAEFHSSRGVTRGHCAGCGTTLTYEHVGRPGEIDVTVASLAEPARITPRSHIWVDDKLPWLVLNDDLPQFLQKVTAP